VIKLPFHHRPFRFSLRIAFAFVTIACVFAAVVAWWQREVPLVFKSLEEIHRSSSYSDFSVHRLPDQPGPYALYQLPYAVSAGDRQKGWVRITYKGRTCKREVVGIPGVEQIFVPLVTEAGKPTYVAFKRSVPTIAENDSEAE